MLNATNWKTFSGAAYAAARPTYPTALYEVLIDYHRETGGGAASAVDLGCGPGTVTTQLSARFEKVKGSDISSAMFDSAPPLPNVEYHEATASSLPFVPSHSVDLVTSGTAAHWFEHDSWWKEMTRIIKPGGSVAVWTFTPGFMEAPPPPSSPPYPASLKTLLQTTQRYSGPFLPYRSPGNHHTYSLYDELPSPPTSFGWKLPPRRWKWGWNGGDGYLQNEGVWSWDLKAAANEGSVEEVDQEIEAEMKTTMSLDELESYYASVSPVISYRAALPAGQRDWLEEQFEKIKLEGGEGWDGLKRVNVRRVLSLVVWKRE